LPRLGHPADTVARLGARRCRGPLPPGNPTGHASHAPVSAQPPQPFECAAERHRAALARSLSRAEESAARTRSDDALAWLSVLAAAGDHLVPDHETKRRQRLATAETRRARSSS